MGILLISVLATIKRLFDITASFFGMLFLCPVLLVTAIQIKIKMPGGTCVLCAETCGERRKIVRLS